MAEKFCECGALVDYVTIDDIVEHIYNDEGHEKYMKALIEGTTLKKKWWWIW